MHRGDIGLSSNPMAQPSGGTDLFEHSLQVFQGLSLRGAKWPTASHHLCPGDNPHLSNPCHGKPRGAQDQEWGWQFLKILNLYSASISCFWPALSLLSQPEDYSLFTYTPQLRFHLTSDLAEDWIFLISLPSQFRGILRYQAQGKPIKKMTLWQNLGYYKFLYHTVTKVLFSTTPLYYVTFNLHTLFRKQSLFFFLFTGEPSIQGYDDKSSGACKSEVEMYLCWLSSWCQTAVALIKDNVIFFYWTPELFLCNFSSCCHSNITLLWATMYSMFAEEA